MIPRPVVDLEGRKGLVTGIANESSIAWGCAKAFRGLEVGLATAYLATDAARLMTGETLYVDGGYHVID